MLTREKKKRKRKEEEYDPPSVTISTKRGKLLNNNDESSKSPRSKDTAVYVTNIPRDAETEEFVQRFGECGVSEVDDEGEPKVKMYVHEDGPFSGEVLVVFFKEDSVTLAVNLMDDGSAG